jgi:intein-encoded DNA endonuclease-like protein
VGGKIYGRKKILTDFVLSKKKFIIYYINKLLNFSKMKKTTTRRQTVTTYVPVSDNIYHDGSSYRVRVSVEGTKYSKNFSSKRKAIQYRNELLGR